MAMSGLLALGVCCSSQAAVKKADSTSTGVSQKTHNRKASSHSGKRYPIHQEWQKKQPFASMTYTGKKQVPAKASARQAKQNIYDYRLVNKYLPDSGRSWLNERNTHPVSPVFTHRGTSLSPVNLSRQVSVYSGASAESGKNRADSLPPVPGSTRFTMNYEKSGDTAEKVSRFLSGKATPDMTTNNDIVETRQNQSNIQLGMEYATGNGRVNASVNYVRLRDMKGANSAAAGGTDNNDSADLKTFAIGYTYDVSSRTSFYGMVAHTDYEKEAMTGYLRGNGSDEDSVTGVQFGMMHKF